MDRMNRLALLLSIVAAVLVVLLACAAALAGTYYWNTSETGTIAVLNDVCALDANHAWAVGAEGTILFNDGSGWEHDPQSGEFEENLWSVFALDSSHVWAVGWNALVIFYDGTQWKKQYYQPNSDHDLFDVSAADASNVYAASLGGTYLYFDGSYWEWQDNGSGSDMNGVYAYDPNHVWMVGGKISFFDGDSWTVQKDRTDLVKVDGLDPETVWAVGEDGTIYFYDGASWQVQLEEYPPIKNAYLRGVSALDENHVWSVGDDGVILFFDGTDWSPQNSGSDTHMFGVSALDYSTVWASGEHGLILRGSLPTITACSPTTVHQGHGLNLHVEGEGTRFEAGSSEVTVTGTGIKVGAASVSDTEHATAPVTVADDAPTGARDVNVLTGGEEPDPLVDGFSVLPAPVAPPQLDSIIPGSGPPDAEVRLRGTNFGTVRGSSTVEFEGTPADAYLRWSDSEIICRVPFDAESGDVVVRTPWGDSNAKQFEMTGFEFHFAEGTTRKGFDTYYCILNPGDETAEVRITYMDGLGLMTIQDIDVFPHSRSTVNAEDVMGEGDDEAHDFSATVECTNGQMIIAERPMYFTYRSSEGYYWTGGHDVIGDASPDTTYYFAEGTTRPGFEPYICVLNPGEENTTARITYARGNGENLVRDVAVSAHSRETVNVKDVLGEGNDPAYDFSATVESIDGQMIVAERPMYFNYKMDTPGYSWRGGHDVVGDFSPDYAYYFAEGTTRPGFDPYICILNPGDEETSVKITYARGNGDTATQGVTVAARTRETVNVKDVLGEGNDPAYDFSATVESIDGQMIVAERPMYFKFSSDQSEYPWTGGHDVIGDPAPDTTYYFAEGTCRAGFVPYICILNPSIAHAQVEVSYMKGDGSTDEQVVTVMAHSRYTVDVLDYLSGGVSADIDFSATVESLNGVGIVVERPMYFSYQMETSSYSWTGGHDVIGF